MHCHVALLSLLAFCAGLAHSSDPSPSPTPSPRSLAQLGAQVELDRTALGGGSTAIVITNENLADLAAAGRLNTAAASAVPDAPPADAATRREESGLRERWRSRHHRQQERVLALEEQLARLDLELAAAQEAEHSRPPGRARRPDRTPALRQRRDTLAARLDRERAELRRIVREARADGAEPGWFR